MDISAISDIKELKSLAFDQRQAMEVAQENLRIILQRLQQVQEAEAANPKKK